MSIDVRKNKYTGYMPDKNKGTVNKMSNESHDQSMPIGLSMAMAQNIDAMKQFGALSSTEQENVIAKARNAQSKAQMQSIVSELAKG